MFDEVWQDLRFGVRMLRKSPGFTTIAVLTIALGIGATTAIFTVVDATLLEPLPYPQPQQLVSIQDNFPGIGAQDVGMSQPEWQDLQHSGVFEYVSPTWFDENNLTCSSQPARVRLLLVAPNYFALLGVQPRLGRGFNPQDNSPGIIPEVVISDGLWKRAFGSDPNILGKTQSDWFSWLGESRRTRRRANEHEHVAGVALQPERIRHANFRAGDDLTRCCRLDRKLSASHVRNQSRSNGRALCRVI